MKETRSKYYVNAHITAMSRHHHVHINIQHINNSFESQLWKSTQLCYQVFTRHIYFISKCMQNSSMVSSITYSHGPIACVRLPGG